MRIIKYNFQFKYIYYLKKQLCFLNKIIILNIVNYNYSDYNYDNVYNYDRYNENDNYHINNHNVYDYFNYDDDYVYYDNDCEQF